MASSPDRREKSRIGLNIKFAKTSIAIGSLLFLSLMVAVSNRWTESFDHAVLLAIRHRDDTSIPLGPTSLVHMFIYITGLGSSTTLGIIAAVVAGYLFIAGKKSDAVFLLVSVIGAWCLFNIIKLAVGRPRPDIGLHLVPASGFSFPSGHSTDSSATYWALALLFAATQSSSWLRACGYALAIVIIALIGASRVYLGVHYPVDVLAGWCCGLVWVLVCWLVTRRLTLGPVARTT
jgi:undecaprenyl-diphosphatase